VKNGIKRLFGFFTRYKDVAQPIINPFRTGPKTQVPGELM